MNARMTIGEVARRTGASIRTLRFYDRLGILSVDGRSEGNYRLFTDGAIACVRCIRELKEAGLTLRQIQRLVQVECGEGDARSALVEAYAEARERLDRQIERLEARRRTLESRLSLMALDSPSQERVQAPVVLTTIRRLT